MGSLSTATRRLASQLHIIYTELQAAHPGSTSIEQPPLTDGGLQRFGRRYDEVIYSCALLLRKEQERASAADMGGDDAAELQAELTRTIWSACIWELAMIVFVAHPAVLTERILPWWQLHLCDRQAEEEEVPRIRDSERPEQEVPATPDVIKGGTTTGRPCTALCPPNKDTQPGPLHSPFPHSLPQPNFWPVIRKLVVRGLPEMAKDLLQLHPGLSGAQGAEVEQETLAACALFPKSKCARAARYSPL